MVVLRAVERPELELSLVTAQSSALTGMQKNTSHQLVQADAVSVGVATYTWFRGFPSITSVTWCSDAAGSRPLWNESALFQTAPLAHTMRVKLN